MRSPIRRSPSNGFVYLYYSRNAGNCDSAAGRFNRVSRFTMSGNTISPGTERVLLDNMAIPAGNHDGGDLHIGADGDLYVSVGDGGTNPRRAGASAAQDLSLLNGKILRITLDGEVPADNPLVGQPGHARARRRARSTPTTAGAREIFNCGLRNPFRIAFDSELGQPHVLHQRRRPEHVGGGRRRSSTARTTAGTCARASVPTARRRTAARRRRGITDPLTAYNHSTGCTFITGGAFVPNGIWPANYDGSYLFADGGCGKIWQRTAAGTVNYDAPFATVAGGATIADMTFMTQNGQTSLYYVTVGSSELHRIWFDRGGRSQHYVVDTGLPNTNVVLQLTTDNYETGTGWTAAYACAAGFKGTSSSNNNDNPIASNLVIVPTDVNGDVCVESYRPTDLIVDLAGSLPGASIHTPDRVLDTRLTGNPLSGQQDRRVHLGPANAIVAAQFTTDDYAGGTGWTAVFACAAGFKGTSSVNNTGHAIASNLVIVPTDGSGDVCVRSQFDTDLVVDVAGTLDRTSVTSPTRVLDTRVPTSSPATDRRVHVGPANAIAVVQVTTDNYTGGTGWTAAYAYATGFTGTSSLNNTANPIASNLAIVPTDANGDVCVRSLFATDLVVDFAGTLGNAQIHSPNRIFDSRVR